MQKGFGDTLAASLPNWITTTRMIERRKLKGFRKGNNDKVSYAFRFDKRRYDTGTRVVDNVNDPSATIQRLGTFTG